MRMTVLNVAGRTEHFVEVHYMGGWQLILKDVTEVVRQRQSIESQRREAEKMEALLHLAGAAAHEMNQPLTVIMGYAGLLLERYRDQLGDEISLGLQTIRDSSDRLSETVKRIRDIQSHKTKRYAGTAEILDLDAASGCE
jgi:signal transduction histidine kinase